MVRSWGRPDDAEALALSMHQLRQAPDYAAALSLPLPLHLAGLAQAYVLPMLAEGDGSPGEEAAEPPTDQGVEDPDLADAAGLAAEPDVDDDDGAEPRSAS
jgi:hypothetical protein